MESKISLDNIVHILSLIKEDKSFNIKDLLVRLNLNMDKLIYSLTMLSEIYSNNGINFLDFEINSDTDIISFEYDEKLLELETITDLDLFKIHTLLNNPKIDIQNLFNESSEVYSFSQTLTAYFASHQSIPNDDTLLNDLFESDELYIEYIKLGQIHPNIYKIKPLSFTSGSDGDSIDAYDYEEQKIKTFIIERIVNIPESNDLKTTFQDMENSLEVIFTDSVNKEEKLQFRSEPIALEYFIKNIDTLNIITPHSVKVEVENRKNKLIKELEI
tara:strand:+ start:1227 stop:2045 length:819 start_codon:yes stop_codon:yes gene_type:complete